MIEFKIYTDWTRDSLNSSCEPRGEVLLFKTTYESEKEITALYGGRMSQERLRVELEDWACFLIESKTLKSTDSLVDSLGLVWFNKIPTATITFEGHETYKVLKSIVFEMEIKLYA